MPPIYCGINLDRYGSVAPLKLNFLDAKQPMDANVAQILPPDRLSPARIFRLSELPDLISTIWSTLFPTLSAQVVGRMLMSSFPSD